MPGMAELLRDGVDGFLYQPDDGESFVAALERVVDDETAAEALGGAGARRATECFDPRASAKGFLRLIEELHREFPGVN